MSGGPNNQLGKIITLATDRALARQNADVAGKVAEVLTTGIAFYEQARVAPLAAALAELQDRVAHLEQPWYARLWRRNADTGPGVGPTEGEPVVGDNGHGDADSGPGNDRATGNEPDSTPLGAA